jgi:CCR4-NOT complex subunit CAF16
MEVSLPRARTVRKFTAHTAGKSTLLQILAGKKLIKGADVTIKGRDVFYQFPEGVTFLGTEWSVRVAIRF